MAGINLAFSCPPSHPLIKLSSVVSDLEAVVGAMERAQVALRLHVHVLQLCLVLQVRRVQLRQAVVANSVSEIVQSQVVNFELVALSREAKVLRSRNMIELSVMTGGHRLETIAEEVSIELHQQAYEGQIIRWNLLLELSVVGIAIRWIACRLQHRVEAINADQSLELVRVVALIKQLSKGICGNFWIVGAHLSNFNELLWVGKLVTQPVVHCIVLVLVPQELVLEQMLLPMVGPTLANFIPFSRIWLWLVVSHTRDVIHAVV